MVVCELDIGKIKKRRRVKRGDGTKRHGRPPDHRPFGHSKSWNRGVYPGRGLARISRADMTILTPTTPSAITFKNSATLLAGVSGHSAAEDTVTETFLSTFAVDSTPGPLPPNCDARRNLDGAARPSRTQTYLGQVPTAICFPVIT